MLHNVTRNLILLCNFQGLHVLSVIELFMFPSKPLLNSLFLITGWLLDLAGLRLCILSVRTVGCSV